MTINIFKIKKGSVAFMVYAFLTLGALGMVVPYVWMIVTSIKPIEEIQAYPP